MCVAHSFLVMEIISHFFYAKIIDTLLYPQSLHCAVSDTGKTILPEHMVLLVNSLSATGEIVGLNARGLARQKEVSSVSSPFVQACFSVRSSR